MKRRDYYAEFGKERQKPGFKAEVLSFVIRVLPKVGPLKALKFKDVGPEGEKLFIKSFDTVLVHYSAALIKLRENKVVLPDIDYDTGKPTVIGEYELTDDTYAEMVDRLRDTKFDDLTVPLKENILAFYKGIDTVKLAQKYPGYWKKTYIAIQGVEAAKPVKIDSLKTDKGIYYKLNEPAVPPAGK